MLGRNYIIITPMHNEERNIECTLTSVCKQTVYPLKWVIVDDGSTDNSAKMIKPFAEKYSWIYYLQKSKSNVPFGTHAVVNFYEGFKIIKDMNWEFIVKLDADLDIDRDDFFEIQMERMLRDPKLGICSGITYSTHTGEKVLTKGRPHWRTGGAMKFYRRVCLTDIGGLTPIYGWDGIDEYKAMSRGWRTRTFFDLHVNHLGKERDNSRQKELWLHEAKGKSLYQRGYPIEFIILKGISLAIKSFAKGLAFFKGYTSAIKQKEDIYMNKKERKFTRKFQYVRLFIKND